MQLDMRLMKNGAGALSTEIIRPLSKIVGAQLFIETGTYLGDTTASMRELFDRVVSIELSEELYTAAKKRFEGDANVVLLQGNSPDRLQDALNLAGGQPSLIWLDAHWSGGATAKADENTPIMTELQVIEKKGSGQDVILVDDIRYFIDLPKGFDVHEANAGYPRLTALVDIIHRMRGDYGVAIIGDVLLAMPKIFWEISETSSVVAATTNLRFGVGDTESLETIVAGAIGVERDTIMGLPDFYRDSLRYGIGGHFCYWRALVLEQDNCIDLASRDFALARRCGVLIPKRKWES